MRFSTETRNYMEENYLTEDEVLSIVDQIQEQTEGMFVLDRKIETTHVMAFSHAWTLSSDETSLLHAVNQFAAKMELEDQKADFDETTFGHWTYSSYDTLAIRVLSDDQTTVEVGAAVLADLQNKLEDYPVLDDELYSIAESNVNDYTMIDLIDDLETTPEIKHRTFQDWRDYSFEPEYDVEPSTNKLQDEDTKENWDDLKEWANNLNLNDLEELTSY